jgi:PIN domain nuclease of toxin-antitoxin system
VIVLDTSAWVFWVAAPDRLSRKARAAIEREEPRSGLVISVISAWEVAVKATKGKLELGVDLRAWLAGATTYPGVVVRPLDLVDAVESTLLPGTLHDDPADRMIIAVARRLGCPLVTADRAIRRYPHVKTIW